jgi:uncharacterized LabA/DUF88 family protein
VDRCALFVDAGYVLADGAMAVHGTRRRESVSWDYEGLLRLFAGLATERSGLPVLRCYWYEATVEGRRSADHDALADLPGVKLRLAKMRPGRREGVESEIHRDLATLARNKAISDAMVISAEEDLAQVVADVQDLGLRVTLLNIAANGDWTISRALRQECDDIVEISSEHLRPYVELIAGAEPPHEDEPEAAPLIALRPASNSNGQHARAAAFNPVPIGPDSRHQVGQDALLAEMVPADMTAVDMVPADLAHGAADFLAASADASMVTPEAAPLQPEAIPPVRAEASQAVDYQSPQPPGHEYGRRSEVSVGATDLLGRPDLQAAPDRGVPQELYGVPQELYGAPVTFPAPPEDRPIELPAARSRQADLSGYSPGASREPLSGDAGEGMHPVPVMPGTAQIRRLPTRGAGNGMPAPAPASLQPQPSGQPPAGPPAPAQPTFSPSTAAQPVMQPAMGQPMAPGTGYPPPARNGSYSGPQPVSPASPAGLAGPAGPFGPTGPHFGGTGMQGVPGAVPDGAMGPGNASGPAYTPSHGPVGGGPAVPQGHGGPVDTGAYQGVHPSPHSSGSLAEAVQSAHNEGQEFGASVARDAPALWLEAVLARKPRMPSDLEARLLQGSALPIDFLLHDEVRHALRRGFWDALEQARR